MGSAPSVDVQSPNSINSSQFGYNTLGAEEQQAMNQTNQITPFGTMSYTPTGVGPGGVPTYTSSTNLSPAEQYLLGIGQTTQGEAGTQAAEILSNANYGAPLNIGSMTSGLTGQMLGMETNALDPYFNQQNEQLTTQLANQGLTYTDPAYQVAMNNLRQSQNQSISGFLASAEPAAFEQAVTQTELPLQNATSLFQLAAPANLAQNLIGTPSTNVGTVNAAGAAGVAQEGLNQEAKLQQAQYSGMLNGIGNLGSALIAA